MCEGMTLETALEQFVHCLQCIFWRKLGEDTGKRCLKNAPKPEITNSLSSVVQEVVWPAPKAFQGCFEGVPKPKEATAAKACSNGCDECNCKDPQE
jgi:hypothetical protein